MNHRNPLAKMEVKKGGTFTAMEHSEYNTYVLDGGVGGDVAAPMTFRITDIYNHVVTDSVTMQKGQVVNGNVQFAACP
jgi:expansin (peptidoglycan-binding protein)